MIHLQPESAKSVRCLSGYQVFYEECIALLFLETTPRDDQFCLRYLAVSHTYLFPSLTHPSYVHGTPQLQHHVALLSPPTPPPTPPTTIPISHHPKSSDGTFPPQTRNG
ncbi:hypothetical protein ACMFMG_008573 [Clarireedia jacksonii]